MFVKVCLLCEAEITARVLAFIWTLICVNAQMVKEIVPFPEPFVALLVIAFKHLDNALRLRVLISKDTVSFCIRDMLLYLNRPKIKSIALFHRDHDVFRYLKKGLAHIAELQG